VVHEHQAFRPLADERQDLGLADRRVEHEQIGGRAPAAAAAGVGAERVDVALQRRVEVPGVDVGRADAAQQGPQFERRRGDGVARRR
jgi:hypothetical protein